MKTINLTQHQATPTQVRAGVVELNETWQADHKAACNFVGIPTPEQVQEAVDTFRSIMNSYDPDLGDEVQFMIGGAPYFMAALTQLAPLYKIVFACSNRVSEEITLPDGTVRKTNTFKHLGFVPMYCPSI